MNRAFIFIVIGAILWGTIGFYVKNLYLFGFTPMEVVTLRVWTATVILLAYLSIARPGSLRLQRMSDLKYFIGTGIFSIIFFNYSLFKTMELSSIPVATALLYTAPAFVIVLSYFLFEEKITTYKLIALSLTILGTALVVGLLPFDLSAIGFPAIIIGLCAGFGYALYSIFSKFALEKYSSATVTAFTFIVASVALIPFFPYREKIYLFTDPQVLLFVFGLGLFPTAVAYIVYTYGLSYTEASKAAIISTIEPVVATCIGMIIFSEPFSTVQMTGMGCILFAVVFIQLDGEKKQPNLVRGK